MENVFGAHHMKEHKETVRHVGLILVQLAFLLLKDYVYQNALKIGLPRQINVLTLQVDQQGR